MFLERIILPVFCLGIKVFHWTLAEEVDIREVAADKGTNVTIPCGGLQVLPASNVQWVHRGNHTHHEILTDGSLFIPIIGPDDSGLYECGVENETSFLDRMNVTVRTEPPPLVNVTVHASTILALILWNVAGDGGHPIIDFTAQYRSAAPVNGSLEPWRPISPNHISPNSKVASTILALILWNVAGDGGHPIIDFTAQYRSAAPVNGSLEPWRPISPNHISPNSRQVDVYHLDTNASYWFRVWATNALGPGPPVEVLATTLYSDQEAELYKHFLEGSESFDTRTWVAAVCVVMGTLLVLAAGTCAVLCREWRRPEYGDEQDVMELVPNIILNPGFMDTEPSRPRETHAASIIRSTECPGPGKPRRV